MAEPDAHEAARRLSARVLDVSDAVLRVERLLIQSLMWLLCALILVNVTTRYAGRPIYWIDEAAVYAVVWLTFIGGSAMCRLRMDFAVTVLTERLQPRHAQALKRVAGVGVLAFGLGLLTMCWIWMDPLGLAREGFDAKEYAARSFNYLYTERTQTLNWPTWVLMLVMPLFALTFSLHAAANLIEDLGWQDRRRPAGFPTSDADAVVN